MRRSNSTGVSGNSATGVNDSLDTKDGIVELTVSPSISSFYEEGEKVWALHGRKWYQAKVQKVESRTKEWTYHIHYLGWKKKWDEWVNIDRLMKFTKEDIQKQLVMEQNSKNNDHMSQKTRCKKGSNDSISEDKGTVTEEKVLNIEIPSSLRKQLVDDCEFVTHLSKLVMLPRTPNVDEILKMYYAHSMKKNNIRLNEAFQEILNGLRCYFDKALSALLLYKGERKQYEEVIAENDSPSTVYGAEHLLRLFVKLPEILYDAKIDEETLTELQRKILDLLKFLQMNQSAFFLSTYQTPAHLDSNI